jgi:nucleoside 2-deoxyribosyltransferase
MSGRTPRIYLAGPDVFFPDSAARANTLRQLCAELGMHGHYPLDGGLDLTGLAPLDAGRKIFDANRKIVRECDAVLANMTPFRGSSMDVGTAWEMGFADALGLPIVGYTSEPRLYQDRVAPDGLMIEEFGMVDNLMVHSVCRAIVPTPREGLVILRKLLAEAASA